MVTNISVRVAEACVYDGVYGRSRVDRDGSGPRSHQVWCQCRSGSMRKLLVRLPGWSGSHVRLHVDLAVRFPGEIGRCRTHPLRHARCCIPNAAPYERGTAEVATSL